MTRTCASLLLPLPLVLAILQAETCLGLGVRTRGLCRHLRCGQLTCRGLTQGQTGDVLAPGAEFKEPPKHAVVRISNILIRCFKM